MEFDIERLTEDTNPKIVLDMTPEEGKDLVNLQMILVTSSLNHEYASKELEKAQLYSRRQELIARMSHLKSLYFAARKKLHYYNPDKLEQIESELRVQKQNVFSEYLA